MKIIPKEDLDSLKDLRMQSLLLTSAAEKSALEARVADLEYHNARLIVFLKHGLEPTDSVDFKTGEVKSPEKEDQ